MRLLLLAAALALTTAACSPAATPSADWNYYDNAPGGIAVTGPRAEGDMLGAQTDAEACAALGAEAFPPGYCDGVQDQGGDRAGAGECQSGSAFELFGPGWSTPGNPWIRRCP